MIFKRPSELIAGENTFLLALSGGIDSVSLLDMLSCDARQNGYRLVLLHYHHGIRGEDADRDADFCRQLAKTYGWEIVVECGDVPALAKEKKLSLETMAREARYDFFHRTMQKMGTRLLVTAHHADDNAETFLYRLCRGTSPSGLTAMDETTPFGSGLIYRPLLHTTRNDVEAYAREKGLAYVTDTTNFELSCDRNRLRLNVLPELKTVNSETVSHVTALMDDLREDEAYFNDLIDAHFSTHPSDRTENYQNLPLPVRRRALYRYVLNRVGIRMTRDNVNACVDAVADGGKVVLLCDFVFEVKDGKIGLYRLVRQKDDYRIPVADGTYPIANGYCLTVSDGVDKTVTQRCTVWSQTLDIMADGCVLAPFQNGLTIRQNGMQKKLVNLWQAVGVTTELRKNMPVLLRDHTVVWAPFVGGADGEIKQKTNKTITLSCEVYHG